MRREELKRELAAIAIDIAEQEIFDATDTSGVPRVPPSLAKVPVKSSIKLKMKSTFSTTPGATPVPSGGDDADDDDGGEWRPMPRNTGPQHQLGVRRDSSASRVAGGAARPRQSAVLTKQGGGSARPVKLLRTAPAQQTPGAASGVGDRRGVAGSGLGGRNVGGQQNGGAVPTGSAAVTPAVLSTSGAYHHAGLVRGAADGHASMGGSLAFAAGYRGFSWGPWAAPRTVPDVTGEEDGLYDAEDAMGLGHALGTRLGSFTSPYTWEAARRDAAALPSTGISPALGTLLPSRASIYPIDAAMSGGYRPPSLEDLYRADLTVQRRLLMLRNANYGSGVWGASWEGSDAVAGGLVPGVGSGAELKGNRGWEAALGTTRPEATALPFDDVLEAVDSLDERLSRELTDGLPDVGVDGADDGTASVDERSGSRTSTHSFDGDDHFDDAWVRHLTRGRGGMGLARWSRCASSGVRIGGSVITPVSAREGSRHAACTTRKRRRAESVYDDDVGFVTVMDDAVVDDCDVSDDSSSTVGTDNPRRYFVLRPRVSRGGRLMLDRVRAAAHPALQRAVAAAALPLALRRSALQRERAHAWALLGLDPRSDVVQLINGRGERLGLHKSRVQQPTPLELSGLHGFGGSPSDPHAHHLVAFAHHANEAGSALRPGAVETSRLLHASAHAVVTAFCALSPASVVTAGTACTFAGATVSAVRAALSTSFLAPSRFTSIGGPTAMTTRSRVHAADVGDLMALDTHIRDSHVAVTDGYAATVLRAISHTLEACAAEGSSSDSRGTTHLQRDARTGDLTSATMVASCDVLAVAASTALAVARDSGDLRSWSTAASRASAHFKQPDIPTVHTYKRAMRPRQILCVATPEGRSARLPAQLLRAVLTDVFAQQQRGDALARHEAPGSVVTSSGCLVSLLSDACVGTSAVPSSAPDRAPRAYELARSLHVTRARVAESLALDDSDDDALVTAAHAAVVSRSGNSRARGLSLARTALVSAFDDSQLHAILADIPLEGT